MAAAGLSKRTSHELLRNTRAQPPANPDDLSICDNTITPACIAALYQIPKGTTANPKNSLGVFESELQFYYQPDLDSFFHTFAREIHNGTHPLAANIDGGMQATTDPYYAGGEVNLDLMLAYPIVYPQHITLYQVDDYIVQANQNDTYTFGFNTFLDALDGVSFSSNCGVTLFMLIIACSLTVPSLLTTRLVMILIWISSIQTRMSEDGLVISCAVSTSQPTSSPSHTAVKKPMSQYHIRSVNAWST